MQISCREQQWTSQREMQLITEGVQSECWEHDWTRGHVTSVHRRRNEMKSGTAEIHGERGSPPEAESFCTF